MKIKPKGRKIYRYKTRFERLKGFLRDTRAVTLTVAGVGVLAFVGYSVGAPVMNFLEQQGIITPSTVTETSATDHSAVVSELSENETQTTEPSVQHKKLCGIYLDKSSLSTQQTLAEALSDVPDGITHVIVPLKAEGGRLYYGTTLSDASMCGAVIAATPLETIYNTILENGYIPAAAINTLEDSVYPQTYIESGYRFAGTSEQWLDDTPENGGKPWLSPFSPITEDYLANLSREVADAGFSVIVCEGLTFPDFTADDLALLDSRAGTSDRGGALVDVVNAMQSAAGDTAFYVSVDADALLNGETELFDTGKPFAPTGVVVTVSDESADKKAEIQEQLQGYSCVLYLKDGGTAQSAVIDGSYIIRP